MKSIGEERRGGYPVRDGVLRPHLRRKGIDTARDRLGMVGTWIRTTSPSFGQEWKRESASERKRREGGIAP